MCTVWVLNPRHMCISQLHCDEINRPCWIWPSFNPSLFLTLSSSSSSLELASKEREQRSEREDLSRKTDTSVIHSSLDSESKSLSEVNNTDSLHSSQDSLEQSAASHSADPTDASPDATPDASPDVDRPLPWNGKSAWMKKKNHRNLRELLHCVCVLWHKPHNPVWVLYIALWPLYPNATVSSAPWEGVGSSRLMFPWHPASPWEMPGCCVVMARRRSSAGSFGYPEKKMQRCLFTCIFCFRSLLL